MEGISIGDAIKEFLSQYKHSDRILEAQLVGVWNQIIDPHINSFTQSVTFKKGKLFVSLSSSVLRNELMMNKRKIIASINEYFGYEVISDIVLR